MTIVLALFRCSIRRATLTLLRCPPIVLSSVKRNWYLWGAQGKVSDYKVTPVDWDGPMDTGYSRPVWSFTGLRGGKTFQRQKRPRLLLLPDWKHKRWSESPFVTGSFPGSAIGAIHSYDSLRLSCGDVPVPYDRFLVTLPDNLWSGSSGAHACWVQGVCILTCPKCGKLPQSASSTLRDLPVPAGTICAAAASTITEPVLQRADLPMPRDNHWWHRARNSAPSVFSLPY